MSGRIFFRPRTIGLHSPAPQSGKTTAARHLALRGFTVVPFAQSLKKMARALCYELGMDHAQIEAALAGNKSTEIYNGVTMRRVLQTLGTDWARQTLGHNVWVHCWRQTVRGLGAVNVVADDVRFDNEAAAVRAMGGEVWGVLRPGTLGAGSHASEQGLTPSLIDRWIVNDGSVESLLAQVDALLERAA